MDGDGLPTEPSGWDKYDDWALGNDDEDKDYLFELFSNAADRETCLERAWGCLMMQGFVFSASKAQQSVTGVMLTEDEVKMIANQDYVDWETFSNYWNCIDCYDTPPGRRDHGTE